MALALVVLVSGVAAFGLLDGDGGGTPAYASDVTPAPVAPGEGDAPELQSVQVTPVDGSDSPNEAAQNATYIERRVLAYVNAERVERGHEALLWHRDLGLLARQYSRRLVREPFQGHYEPDGTGPSGRMAERGYECRDGAEVLDQTGFGSNSIITDGSYGRVNYTTADGLAHGIARDWMQSAGHRGGILDPEYTVAGVGVYVSADNSVQAGMLLCERDELDVATDANATAPIAQGGVVEDECRLTTAYPNMTSYRLCETEGRVTPDA